MILKDCHINRNMIKEFENFIPEETAKLLYEESKTIPKKYWTSFSRAGSYMEECNDLKKAPVAQSIVNEFHSKDFLIKLEKISGIKHLLPDPYLVGAGYMKSYNGDSLKVHSDFNWNEECQTHRALSVNLYFTPDWDPKWGGNLQFWDSNKTKKLFEYSPKMGNAIIWEYHSKAFHGYPEPMTCPKDKFRVGFRLFYYVCNAIHNPLDPPHKSLYWYDKEKNKPYHLESDYGHNKL